MKLANFFAKKIIIKKILLIENLTNKHIKYIDFIIFQILKEIYSTIKIL